MSEATDKIDELIEHYKAQIKNLEDLKRSLTIEAQHEQGIQGLEVSYDRERLGRLRRCYNEAVENGSDQFQFGGQQLLTAYAKYMIEYLDTKLR